MLRLLPVRRFAQEAVMRGPISTVTKAAMALVMATAMLAGACGGSSKNPPPDGGDASSSQTFKVILLQTNDIHSNLEGHDAVLDYTPATTGDDQTVGGISRLATRIAAERAAAGDTPVMLLDSGDFLMGTAFEFVMTPDAAELQEMQALSYDAITLGNHEFDWTPSGLFLVLTAARTHGFNLPIVASNLKLDPAQATTFTTAVQGMTLPKLVKTLPNGLKVGIFGLLGRNAAQVAPTAAPFTFDPLATTATAMVSELRNQDHVDLVIALSHSGINQAGMGEDADLAASVPGIDVILSGHTHDALTTAVTVGKTVITQTGRYGEHLGKLALTVTRAGGGTTVALDKYDLLAIDDSVKGDAPTQARVDQYKADINAKIMPLAYGATVAQTSFDVLTGNGETAVGDLVSDAYRAVTAPLFPTDPPVIGIDAAGGLRAKLAKGKTGAIAFADAFNVVPLGIGPDTLPGYPLVTFYLNASEIRAGLELAAAGEVVGGDFVIQASGLTAHYDMTKAPFQRITSLKIGDTTVGLTDTTPCFRIVTTLYVGSLLPVVGSVSGGTLSVAPKQKDCSTVITDMTQQIVYTGAGNTMAELKAWKAFLGFLTSLPPGTGGVPAVPSIYMAPQGRIVTP
jgi:5'-nucleotidase